MGRVFPDCPDGDAPPTPPPPPTQRHTHTHPARAPASWNATADTRRIATFTTSATPSAAATSRALKKRRPRSAAAGWPRACPATSALREGGGRDERGPFVRRGRSIGAGDRVARARSAMGVRAQGIGLLCRKRARAAGRAGAEQAALRAPVQEEAVGHDVGAHDGHSGCHAVAAEARHEAAHDLHMRRRQAARECTLDTPAQTPHLSHAGARHGQVNHAAQSNDPPQNIQTHNTPAPCPGVRLRGQ